MDGERKALGQVGVGGPESCNLSSNPLGSANISSASGVSRSAAVGAAAPRGADRLPAVAGREAGRQGPEREEPAPAALLGGPTNLLSFL